VRREACVRSAVVVVLVCACVSLCSRDRDWPPHLMMLTKVEWRSKSEEEKQPAKRQEPGRSSVTRCSCVQGREGGCACGCVCWGVVACVGNG